MIRTVILLILLITALGCQHPESNNKTHNETGETGETVSQTGQTATSVAPLPENIQRVSPQETLSRVQSHDALLVCAYDDDTFRKVALVGAISRGELEKRLPDLSKEQVIIFYCA